MRPKSSIAEHLNRILGVSAFRMARSISGIAAFFLFPAGAYRYFFAPVPKIHVPLFDFALFYSPIFIFIIKSIYLIALVAFIFGNKVEFSGAAAAVSKFILYITLPDHIFPFAYLLPFGWIAFSVIELGQKNKISSYRAEAPLVFFMCSVYLSAAFHKLSHFKLMKNFISMDLTLFARPDIKSVLLNYCPKMDCTAVDFLLYSSIPAEILLFLLFAFRRTRIWGFIFAIIFHFALGTFWLLIPISFICLLFESSIFLLRFDILLGDLWLYKRTKLFLTAGIFALLCLGILGSVNNPEVRILYNMLFSALACLPFVYLANFFAEYRPKSSLSQINDSLLKNKRWFWSNVAAVFVFILFSVSPALVDNYKKTFIWGWTVFSGAETKRVPKKVRLKISRCERFPTYFPLLLIIPSGPQEYEFISTSEEFLDRYLVQLKKECE